MRPMVAGPNAPRSGVSFLPVQARESTSAINFAWLVRLRFGAIAGQIVTILGVAYGMKMEIPLAHLGEVIAIELASNVFCLLYFRSAAHKIRDAHLASILAADVFLLTALLYYSGGPHNPFSFLYLVHIALAAVVLPPRYSWPLVGLSVLLFGGLFLKHVPLAHAHHQDLHVQGMWVAFGVAAAFIVYFVQRVTRALAARDAELDEQRQLTERSAKLTSLAALAAGAAHELSTPLSTIAVVAKELERQITKKGDHDAAIEDAQLIRSEVERCRGILRQMAAGAGQSTGEPFVRVPVRDLVSSSLAEVGERERERVKLLDGDDEIEIEVPLQALALALRAVVNNAIQASKADGVVTVRAARARDAVEIAVSDQGVGIAPENLERVGDPFFTTKEPGQGMGLGLFLTRTLLERLGGRFQLDSKLGSGTRASIVLPIAKTGATIRRAETASAQT